MSTLCRDVPVLFIEEGKNVDELRITGYARIALCQTGLIVIGRVTRDGSKKYAESKSAHGSPPSRRVDARCLIIDSLCYSASRQDRIRTVFPQRGFLCVYQIQPSTASMKIMPVDESNKSTSFQGRNEGALGPKSPPIGSFMGVRRIADSRHTTSAATIASNPEKISE